MAVEKIDWNARVAELRERSQSERREEGARAVGLGGVAEDVSLEAAHEKRWDRAIPMRYRHARLSDLSGDLAGVAEWDGKSDVLLLGNVGAGKTHAAVALARQAHDSGLMVMFRPALALIEAMKPGRDDQALERATSADLLLLDDLGTERQTDFAADRLSLLLVTRYDDCKPTVVTSNLSPDLLERQVGERVWSRLYHDSLRIATADVDRRRVA